MSSLAQSPCETTEPIQQSIDLGGLRLVLAAVRESPARQFDMASWNKQSDCGTSACAIGWFCMKHPDDKMKLVQHPEIKGWTTPTFRGLFDFYAVAVRFGLKKYEADELFGMEVLYKAHDGVTECRNPTKAEFLTNLEQFILDHEPSTVFDAYGEVRTNDALDQAMADAEASTLLPFKKIGGYTATAWQLATGEYAAKVIMPDGSDQVEVAMTHENPVDAMEAAEREIGQILGRAGETPERFE